MQGDQAGSGSDIAKGRRGRRTFIATVATALLGLSSLGLLAIAPEHILFQGRLNFSVFDLDAEQSLRAFDQRTYDSLTLRSWYRLPTNEKPTIVYFAGRDGDLLRKPGHLLQLADAGYGLLLVGYRGYGGNPGRPSERSMFLDAAALLSQAQEAGLAPWGYVLYGYSMGSSVAANAAVQVRPRGLILEAPISKFSDAVRQQVNRFPRWLVRTHFDNVARIGELDIPTLLLAGGRDTITPPTFALALAAARDDQVTLKVYDEATHFSIIRHGGRRAVIDFLEELDRAPESSA